MSGQVTIKSEVAPRAVDAARRAVHTARRALATARSVDEVKDIRDRADGMRVYAKQAKDKSLELDAAEIRFRAEHRLGEFMIAQKRTVGLAKGAAEKGIGRRGKQRGSKGDPQSGKPTLEEAGIGKQLADRARKWAAMPRGEFEACIAEWRKEFESASERVTIRLLQPRQLELPKVANPPLASSGRRLERVLEINRHATPERKLQAVCENLIKAVVDGVRRLEELTASIDQPNGVDKFKRAFDRFETRVMVLVEEHWHIFNEPIRDSAPEWEPAEPSPD